MQPTQRYRWIQHPRSDSPIATDKEVDEETVVRHYKNAWGSTKAVAVRKVKQAKQTGARVHTPLSDYEWKE